MIARGELRVHGAAGADGLEVDLDVGGTGAGVALAEGDLAAAERRESSRFLDEAPQGQVGLEGIEELKAMDALLGAMGLPETQVLFDPTIVRGLGYYTGPVFEAVLTFEIVDKKGRKRSFGSVAGGG